MANPKDRAVQDQAGPIARHEFGHYIVGKVLGFNVGDVSLVITFGKGHRGTSEYLPATTLDSMEKIAAYTENRVIMLYAGALAETLEKGKSDNAKALRLLGAQPAIMPNEDSASQDYAKARELIHLLRSMNCPLSDDPAVLQPQLNEISDRVWARAVKLVEAESDLIAGLGRNLAKRIVKSGQKETITKSEIEQIESFKERFPKNSN